MADYARGNCLKERELISVLMAVYNTEVEFLGIALDSIISQTYQNLEIVIIDDGSTDLRTKAYLDGIKDKRVHIYRNKQNIGLTKSLNKGIRLCHGRYIARMDADDVSEKNRIEEQYNFIKKHPCIMVGCKTYMISTHKLFCSVPNSTRYKIGLCFGNRGPAHSTFFLDKQRMLDIGLIYNEDYRTCQDYAFVCECITRGEMIGMVKSTMVGYRVHDKQISRTQRGRQLADEARIRKDYIKRNYTVKSETLAVLIQDINDYMYCWDIDLDKVQSAIIDFSKDNSDEKIMLGICRFWFEQCVFRYKYTHKTDFMRGKMFFKLLRPDRLLYIIGTLMIDRFLCNALSHETGI